MRVFISRLALAAVILLTGLLSTAAAQSGSKEEAAPGGYHNRIEYHDFHWQVFHTPAFHLYFPLGADSLAAFTGRELLPAQALIKKRMGGSPVMPQAVIIYPSLTAQYESSIGSRQTVPLTIPTFVSKGSRIVLHYQGSYEALKTQLYEALVRAAWEKELEQSNSIGQQVKGAFTRAPIPYWCREGAIRYFATQWPLEDEEALCRALRTDSPASFYVLAARHPALTGAAFCYYLLENYWEGAPRQLYFQLRKGKPWDRALRLVCKRPADSLYADCFQWYQRRCYGSIAETVRPDTALGRIANTTAKKSRSEELDGSRKKMRLPFKASKKGTVLRYLLDPAGKKLALLVSFPDHKRAVYIYGLSSGVAHKSEVMYRLPPWLSNHEADKYPLLSWTANSELLITCPLKGKLRVSRVSSEGKLLSKISLPHIDGLSSLTALDNNHYLLCAWLQGQNDLVVYDANRDRYTPLTNDAADESSPVFLGEQRTTTNPAGQHGLLDKETIYFTSIRKGDTAYGQDTLPRRHGIYALEGGLVRPVLTDTLPYVRFAAPDVVDGRHLLLSATVRGKTKLALLPLSGTGRRNPNGNGHGESDKADLQILTDDMPPYQYLPQSRSIAFFSRAGDSLLVTIRPLDKWIKEQSDTAQVKDTSTGPWLLDYYAGEADRRKEDSVLKAAKSASGPSFIEGVFSSIAASSAGSKDKKSDSLAYRYAPSKAKPYVLQLYSAYFSAQVNNDYFINRYQPYGAFQGTFKFPDVGGMISGGLSDLFEHHHLSIAYRLPAGTDGSMFFTKYSNTAKRLDWSLAYYRDVESLRPDPERAWVDENGRHYPSAAKVKTHYYELSLSYPLSYYSSVGGALFFRKDRTVFLATDNYSLPFPALTEMWAGLPLWAESRHLRPTLRGLYRGWQGSVATDVFKSITGKETFLGAVKLSAEWHKPLYRYITLVLKGQAAFSGGDRKVLYNLGGVDNNLTPRIDTTVHFSQDAPFAFQSLVTPFRGYEQNSLYGSRYALFNTDVYFPLFQSLIPVETPFPSINGLQVGLFTDVASAGGESRYTTEGKGWLWSYGLSARTRLAGYPLRFDIGWPGSFKKEPIWYLSLSLQ